MAVVISNEMGIGVYLHVTLAGPERLDAVFFFNKPAPEKKGAQAHFLENGEMITFWKLPQSTKVYTDTRPLGVRVWKGFAHGTVKNADGDPVPAFILTLMLKN